MPPAERGRETALLLQPNISETEQWTAESVDAMKRRQVMLSLRGALSEPADPPSIIVWPEVPAPLYYFEDPVLRGYVDNLARAAQAYVLLGIVAHTPSGAPLNSAALVSPEGAAGQPLRQGEPGAVRRVRAVAVRLRQQNFHRDRRFRGGQARGGFAGRVAKIRRPQNRHLHLLRERVPELRAQIRRGRRGGSVQHLQRRLVRQERRAPAASQHGAHARRGESPLDPAIDQRRHHRDHRFRRAGCAAPSRSIPKPPPTPASATSRSRPSTRASETGSPCSAPWPPYWPSWPRRSPIISISNYAGSPARRHL